MKLARTFQDSDVQAAFQAIREGKRLADSGYQQPGFIRILNNMRKTVSDWILETRQIPDGKAKKLEIAIRTWAAPKRVPNDVEGWWDKNGPTVNFILEAEDWPLKAEDGGQVLTVGGFKVHNTQNLPLSKLEGVVHAIEQVSRLIQTHGLGKNLYGNLFLVGKLLRANTLAWYNYQHDELSLRTNVKIGRGEIHNLAHEIGHRQWYQFTSKEKQQEWRKWFLEIEYSTSGTIHLPDVGDSIPGQPDQVIVSRDSIWLTTNDGKTRYKVKDVFNYLKARQRESRYPTQYASTSVEEFFAECFALFVRGELSEPFLSRFQDLVL